jgi:hypothetical protein
MVGIVPVMEHRSLAHALIDIPVSAAKLMVNIIFKK